MDVYQAFSLAPESRPPAGLVWLRDWGCAIWSLIDCRDLAGPMWAWGPTGCCLEHALFPQQMTLAGRLTKALDGTLEIPCWSGNPH
ncbi:hypothetical protein [Actinoallomurus rhizosphaericola]|uniref:hypothetical protein n=1 Tax=Actinoallomurus rhizosphaericola TaxID=2952536 RepID=UPI002093BD0B|nr:hypothetical protein [Actinoallomurus rhizosphaericola]